MRPHRWILLASCLGASACAAILGIDDGTPRGTDAGPDVAAGDVSAGDAAPADATTTDGPFVALACGLNAQCNAAVGEVCCRMGSATYTCVDGGAACVGGTVIACDRPDMCPPDDAGGPVVCCGDIAVVDGGSVATAVACKPVAACDYASHAWFCADAGDCPDGAACIQSTFTLPDFLLCK